MEVIVSTFYRGNGFCFLFIVVVMALKTCGFVYGCNGHVISSDHLNLMDWALLDSNCRQRAREAWRVSENLFIYFLLLVVIKDYESAFDAV